MKVYHQALDILIPRFEKLTFTHLLRENNRFVHALATLSSMVDIPLGVKMRPIIIEQKYMPAYKTVTAIDEVQDKNPWYYDIWNFLENEMYPLGANAKEKRGVRRLAVQSIICEGKLYKRGHWECTSCMWRKRSQSVLWRLSMEGSAGHT